jgi:hypothetical protein
MVQVKDGQALDAVFEKGATHDRAYIPSTSSDDSVARDSETGPGSFIRCVSREGDSGAGVLEPSLNCMDGGARNFSSECATDIFVSVMPMGGEREGVAVK